MKSVYCFKLEDGDLQLLLSSNLVANYNHDHQYISHEHSTVIELLITDTDSFTSLLHGARSVLEFESLNNTNSFLHLLHGARFGHDL